MNDYIDTASFVQSQYQTRAIVSGNIDKSFECFAMETIGLFSGK